LLELRLTDATDPAAHLRVFWWVSGTRRAFRPHGAEAGGVRLPHAAKSRFGQFNHPIIMEDEIQAGVEKAVGHGSG